MTSRFKPWNMPLIPAKKFLWNDEFSNALAAASVHGSPMTPGPGTRTVVDTASKITVADGKLFINGGNNTYGDPGHWADTIVTRAQGQVVAFKFIVNDVTAGIEFGLDTGKTGELAGHRIRIASDTLLVYDGTTAGPVCAIPTDGTECVVAFALRTAGCKVYLKCGTGYFEFLWSTNTLTTATLYAGISNYSAVAYCDFIRPAKRKWLSAPLVSDSFTGAAGTMNGRASDGAGHLETSGVGSGGIVTWSGSNGAVDGSGNLVITPSLGEELLTDGGFENWASDTDLTSWNESTTGTSTINKESSIIRSGSFACRADIDALNSACYPRQGATVANTWYVGTVYAKSSVSGTTIAFGRTTQTIAIPPLTTDYALRRGCIRATGISAFAWPRLSAASSSIYFDDASVKPITFSTTYIPQTLPTKDVYIKASFTLVAGLQAGVIFGLNAAGTSLLLAYMDGTNFKLEICEAGTWTAKSTIANTAVTAVEMIIRRRGTAVWVYVNQVLMGAGPTTTLSAGEDTNLSGLQVGPFSTNEANTYHSFVVEPIGTANELVTLERILGV